MPSPDIAPPEIAAVLDQYEPLSLEHAESLGSAGGFSGARFWKLYGSVQTFCLRCWPEPHPDRQRLEWIHGILRYAIKQGLDFVPRVVPAVDNKTWVWHQGHHWELTTWLPGVADYRRAPSREKLRGAMQTLAQLHRAIARMPGETVPDRPSPGLARRLTLLRQWQTDKLLQLERLLGQAGQSPFQSLAGKVVNALIRHGPLLEIPLAEMAARTWLLRPCLRDIWYSHVLYVDQHVTGIVDYGAVDHESPAGDVARLLGSMVDDSPNGWADGLEAYQAVWPLSAEELKAVRVFDRSGLLLGALNWLDWIYLDARQFSDEAAVLARLEELVARLESW